MSDEVVFFSVISVDVFSPFPLLQRRDVGNSVVQAGLRRQRSFLSIAALNATRMSSIAS